MKKIIIVMCLALTAIGCTKHDFDYNPDNFIKENVRSIFGVDFPETQDWVMMESGMITVSPDSYGTTLLVCLNNSAGYPVLKEINKSTGTTLWYNIPIDNQGLYILHGSTGIIEKVNRTSAATRAASIGTTIIPPATLPTLSGPSDTYASKRGYAGFSKGTLWDTSDPIIEVPDYPSDFKDVLKAVVFTYFPNGRAYDNLPQIKESGYYNEKSYPITTGDYPIVVSPVYRNDGTSKEVENCDLYYYYFKGTDPGPEVIKTLPLYKAIKLSESIVDNNVVQKHHSYVLPFWGDATPTTGQEGQWQFPEGYKIGFMLRSKVSKVKEGELWADGRLNKEINHYGHFATSKLGDSDPRMAWLSVNGHMLLCCESGTDRDYNDLIFEVEGGVEPIPVDPDFTPESYYFCYEDQNLGDYDMNDVVLRGRRLTETTVEWALMATGAHDELYIHGISGARLNEDTEVHDLFGVPAKTFINTVLGGVTKESIKDTVTVEKEFSFLDPDSQPWIYNKSRNYPVKVATAGQDPHAIVVPWEFRWPLERVCIKDAYLGFNSWGLGEVTSIGWYKFPEPGKVYE